MQTLSNRSSAHGTHLKKHHHSVLMQKNTIGAVSEARSVPSLLQVTHAVHEVITRLTALCTTIRTDVSKQCRYPAKCLPRHFQLPSSSFRLCKTKMILYNYIMFVIMYRCEICFGIGQCNIINIHCIVEHLISTNIL
jgi:hypothetical protein